MHQAETPSTSTVDALPELVVFIGILWKLSYWGLILVFTIKGTYRTGAAGVDELIASSSSMGCN